MYKIVLVGTKSEWGEEMAVTQGQSNLDLSRSMREDGREMNDTQNCLDLQPDLYKGQEWERLTLLILMPQEKRKNLPLSIPR